MAKPDNIRIRPAETRDRVQWQPLWEAYNAFYKASLPPEVTEATWKRILDPTSTIHSIVAEALDTGRLVGFIHYIIHPRTWHAKDACYLEDFYVDETMRGAGIGRLLCDDLKTRCKTLDLSRIYWHTQENNDHARRLYDQIAAKDEFIRYVMPLTS